MNPVVIRTLIAEMALVAGYYSLRLMVGFVRSRRHHIAAHAFWMNAALFISASVIVTRMIVKGGASLNNWDLILATQAGFLIAGLRPLWLRLRSKQKGASGN